jgi:hypothetical protein
MKRRPESVSSFWLDRDFSYREYNESANRDPFKLAAYRSAISNFVRISTGQNIPVKFVNSRTSFTDGESITISASLNDKKFDSTVGLALHEAAHIKLTDFKLFRNLRPYIESSHNMAYLTKYSAKYNTMQYHAVRDIESRLRELFNIVEDRRIDNYIYTSAPGYQGYYRALYDEYFNSRIIDKGLRSSEYRTEDWDSYMFRIINITNVNRDLDALKSLRMIWDVLDLRNINRLKTSADALDIAWQIFQIVEDSIPAPELHDSVTPDDETSDDTAINDRSESEQEDDMDDESDDVDSTPISPAELTKIQSAYSKQQTFINGNIKKTTVSSKLEQAIESITNSDIEFKDITFDSYNTHRTLPVTVIRKPSVNLFETISSCMWTSVPNPRIQEAIDAGVLKGIMLGKKLQVRQESRDTKFVRQRSGKLDKRRISSAGYADESIFERIENFSHNPGIIHISIDNSGSMSGTRLLRSVTTATAIAKACSMIQNLDCVISFRAAGDMAGREKAQPIIMYMYDSRVHKFSDLRKLMPYISCHGSTPEGLCFDAIMEDLVGMSHGKDAFFVNFSDGEPGFNSYSGIYAIQHTAKQVNKIRAAGVHVLSYFIGNSNTPCERFQRMYGNDSQFINVDEIYQVAKTMNKKFLSIN